MLRLADIVEASGRLRHVMGVLSLEAFEADWQAQWLAERGVLIISEASRHLPEELKLRHPGIPWRKIAAIGNVLRHAYERVSASIMWKLVEEDLHPLTSVCLDEIARSGDSSTPPARS